MTDTNNRIASRLGNIDGMAGLIKQTVRDIISELSEPPATDALPDDTVSRAAYDERLDDITRLVLENEQLALENKRLRLLAAEQAEEQSRPPSTASQPEEIT